MHTYKRSFIDFETQSACDLTKSGSYIYAKHPSTKILCMAFCFDDGPIELWWPGVNDEILGPLIKHVEDGGEVWGHNVGSFEVPIWNTIGAFQFGWPELKIEQCQDTMALSYAMALPGSLEKAAAAVGITEGKDLVGGRIMMKLSQPKRDGSFHTKKDSPEDFEKLGVYCIQDVRVERELGKRLMPLSAKERALWLLDYKINNRGVYVDTNAATAAIKVVEFEKSRLDKDLFEVTKGAIESATQAKQICNWLTLQGFQTDSVSKNIVLDFLARTDLPSHVRRVLEIRQEGSKSSTAKLESMMLSASFDKRIRGCFQYHGAATGRFAGRRVQLQNLPRPNLKPKDIERVFEILESVN